MDLPCLTRVLIKNGREQGGIGEGLMGGKRRFSGFYEVLWGVPLINEDRVRV